MTAASHERSDLRHRPGVYAARFEGAGRPWCGMKTRFTFIVRSAAPPNSSIAGRRTRARLGTFSCSNPAR